MKSNLKLVSNLYVRKQGIPLEEDDEFLSQVRGVDGIRKLLWKAFEIYPDAKYSDPSVRHLLVRGKLSKAQVDCLQWGIRCYQCDAIPVGRTFAGGSEFRCTNPECK